MHGCSLNEAQDDDAQHQWSCIHCRQPAACRQRRPSTALLAPLHCCTQASQAIDQAVIDEMFGGCMPKQEIQAQAFLKVGGERFGQLALHLCS